MFHFKFIISPTFVEYDYYNLDIPVKYTQYIYKLLTLITIINTIFILITLILLMLLIITYYKITIL